MSIETLNHQEIAQRAAAKFESSSPRKMQASSVGGLSVVAIALPIVKGSIDFLVAQFGPAFEALVKVNAPLAQQVVSDHVAEYMRRLLADIETKLPNAASY